MIKLGVNVDHVATVRQARQSSYPDPMEAALAAERGGAAAITLHLREDRRHIQDFDLFRIRDRIKIHLNQEMAPTNEMAEIALELRPHEVCLVPERREELTTEGGLDAAGMSERLAPIIEKLRRSDARISLFIEPERHQIEAAAQWGADFVELHTGKYANLADADLARIDGEVVQRAAPQLRRRNANAVDPLKFYSEATIAELAKLRAGVQMALDLDLKPNVGHGLNYRNVGPVAAIPGLAWAHIGHAIVARSIIVGMERAVREMRALLNQRPARKQ